MNDTKIIIDKINEDIEKITNIQCVHYEAIDDARNHIKINTAKIDIALMNIEKFSEDFGNVQKRFESIQGQTKIFYNNIKDHNIKIEILMKEREIKIEFNKRVNNNIVDIQTRLEKLESSKENSILKRLEKLENKFNDMSVKNKRLENNTKDELIDSLKSKLKTELKKEIEKDITLFKKTYDLKITSLIEKYENKITEFDTKQSQSISEINRLTNEIENIDNSRKFKEFIKEVKDYSSYNEVKIKNIDEQILDLKNSVGNLSNKNHSFDNEDVVKKINEQILDLKTIVGNISNKNVKEDIDSEQIKMRISNIEQQIIHHMNLLSQNEVRFIQYNSMLNQLYSN